MCASSAAQRCRNTRSSPPFPAILAPSALEVLAMKSHGVEEAVLYAAESESSPISERSSHTMI
eukprot:CAMPEP_0173121870 /NCGR_PEP_ID=MMETSP1102-20130122/53667_1 /TAXON_ID=49646 /ORGANISM="Geminigera sp., Strain Caron Lab Isolate" /LENGTH=62 /DNA_ID=CAMNT_0014028807 /DNA_START=267 /DNA_END=455 /DNA_ORIENTATION=-